MEGALSLNYQQPTAAAAAAAEEPGSAVETQTMANQDNEKDSTDKYHRQAVEDKDTTVKASQQTGQTKRANKNKPWTLVLGCFFFKTDHSNKVKYTVFP